MQALSRYREFAADRGAAVITGRPSALASALTEDLERHGADPAARPARARGAERVLHLPARRQARRSATCSRRTRRWRSGSRALAAARDAAAGHRRVMGFLDILTGKRKIKPPRRDRLFAMTTADDHARDRAWSSRRAGKAAIVFQPLATADFEPSSPTWRRSLARHRRGHRARRSSATDDSFGYRWMILRDPDFEDLVVGDQRRVRSALAGRRLRRPRAVRRVRVPRRARASPSTGSTTTSAAPSTRSCPRGGEQRRDTERELRLQAQIGAELPVEPELERWFPLWGIPI